MNKRALIIVHDNYQDDNYFPLGAAYVAACFDLMGIEVETYCMDVFHYTNDELKQFLDERVYEYICLGYLAGRFTETIKELSQVISKSKKSAKFIIGGHGVSPMPEYMLRETKADIAIIGEAESQICELCSDTPLYDIKGIAYVVDGEIVINERAQPIKKLDKIPFPLWDAFPMEKYINSAKWKGWQNDDKTFCIITTRGCVNKCNFCYRMEKGIRMRSIENVVDEMKILHEKYGVNYFLIQDECFIINKSRLEKFVSAIEKLDFDVKYYCDSIVNRFSDEIAKLLVESGCQFVNFGFESDTQRVLNMINKRTTIEQNRNAAEIASRHGLSMGLNFLWNEPGDDYETLKQNVDFIKEFSDGFQLRTIKPVTPYPGSGLFYRACSDGKLDSEADFYDKLKNSDLLTVNFMDMTDEEAYAHLFEANSDLIRWHGKKTNRNKEAIERDIEAYRRLYFENDYTFRGLRHYN